ncbi:MAG: EAL domain-containing protein [Campylobacterota bacterium]
MFIRIFIFLVICFQFLYANVTITDGKATYADFSISYFFDDTNEMSVKDVAKHNFTQTIPSQFTLGYTDKNIWFKLKIENKSKASDFILFFTEPFWDKFDLYEQTPNGWGKQQAGLLTPLSKRKIEDSFPAFPITIDEGETKTLYVNGQTVNGYLGAFELYTSKEYFRPGRFDINTFYRLYAAILIIIVLLNLYLFVEMKERINAYYIGYVSAYIVFVSMFSSSYLYYGLSGWSHGLHTVGAVVLMFISLFSNSFLDLYKNYPVVDKIFKSFTIIFAVFALMMSLNMPYFTLIFNVFAFMFMTALLIMATKTSTQNNIQTKYYLYALIIYMPTMGMMALTFDGVLLNSDFTRYSFLIGALIEIILFSLILASRFHIAKYDKIRLQKELLLQKEKYEEYLEEKVIQRTQDLEKNKKLLDEAQRIGKIGSWQLDLVNNTLSWSDEIYNMFEVDLAVEPSYEIFLENIHPDDRELVNEAYASSLKNKKPYEIIHRLLLKDGKIRYIKEQCETKFDEKGHPLVSIGTVQDITKQHQMENELLEQKNILDHQAHHDSLTGLPNRVLFNDRLEQAIEKAKRKNSKVALLFIDLDHFKEINDSLGHSFGDEVLKTVTSRLKDSIRKEDSLARFGGDEFTVILEDLNQGQDASLIASKILLSLSKAIDIEEHIMHVSSSIGISLYPDDGEEIQNLLKYADSAMYKAKDEGRNNYQYYSSEMTELAFERVVMETALRAGIKKEEFVVYYQPQVDGVTDKLIGMEALVRWQHPTMGLVSPAKFIPLAESTGLIVELDRYVMKTAMKQMAQWYKDELNPGVLAMNLAVKQLKQDDFIDLLQSLLEESNCKPQWIELEVTEGQVMNNPEEAIKILQGINDLGIELAIDDFGTGYSSLAYLKRLPINKLKIDQAFVRELPDDEEDVGITRAVIALAKSLNLRIIAEGVETKEQKDFLVENGCKDIQGYFYAKPMPADEMEIVLQKGLV